MRIVGGSNRRRRLAVPPGDAVRPTADRVREALFDILLHGRFAGSGNPLADASVLDAFAGTGALGLEALSRGADEAFFIERDAAALAALRQNIKALGEEGRTRVIPGDATRPPPAARACAVAFLDPPYRSGLAPAALAALAAAGWLAADALAVVEVGAREGLAPPSGFRILDQRAYGAARLVFLGWAEGAGQEHGVRTRGASGA
jgi:16S rRNA (guanine966-N2)-methyltransferase